MPEIITSHLTHIYWALFCLLVAVLVHFWPTIKTWWAARKAAAEAEAKRVKAALELAAGDVESVYTRIKGDLQAYVAGTEAKIKALEAKIKALEAKIDAQVKADEAKVQAAASNGQAPPVEPPPAQAPVAELETPNLVHGWVPPVAQA
jgi:peptidoglycan hydrolase CwlO-like protein